MNSCRDCTKRTIGCHGKCEDYKKWCKEIKRQKILIKKEKAKQDAFFYR